MEKFEWDKLIETKRTERVVSTTFVEKILPDGVYVCPNCYGSGCVTEIYRDPGPNKMKKCPMCKGLIEITKCPTCNNNPVPNSNPVEECIDCKTIRWDKNRKDFIERVNKGEIVK